MTEQNRRATDGIDRRQLDSPPFTTGLKCTFFGRNPHADLLCPFCGQNLQISDEDAFWKKIQDFELGNYKFDHFAVTEQQPADWKPREHQGYMLMWLWAKGQPRCFRHAVHLKNAYKKYQQIDVDLTL